jgi:hypothetical protein
VAAGGDAHVVAEHTISKEWKNYGDDDVMDIAAARGKAAKSVVEPREKKPDKEKRKTQAPTGTRDDPIEMKWAKPLSHYWNPIHLDDPRGIKRPFSRDNSSRIKGGLTIGVPGWLGYANQVFQRRAPTPRDSSVTDRYMEALKDADWEPTDNRHPDDYQPDHIHDLAYGGRDDASNLWPLLAETNMKAGRYHHHFQVVTFNFPDDGPDRKPRRAALDKEARDDSGRRVGEFWTGRWFKITEVIPPP